MKVLANETKRILAVLLSVAMIFAYVPSTVSAYADDDVSGNNTEETAVEEDVVTDDPLDYYEDADLQFAQLANASDDDYRNIIYLAGEKAGVFAVESDTGVGTVAVDSTRDTVFYVAPLMGYNWESEYSLTKPPVTLEGSYKLKGAADATELKKNVDYKIEKSDVKLANAGADDYYDMYDLDQAYKVTLIGTYEGSGSTFMGKLAQYKAALHEDGDASAPSEYTEHVNEIFETGSSYNQNIPGITVYIAKNASSKSESGIDDTLGKVGIGSVSYSTDLTDPEVSLEQDAYRWTYDYAETLPLSTLFDKKDKDKAIEATLTLVPTEGDPITLEEGATKDYTKWDGAAKTLELSADQVNALYSASREVNGGYKLHIAFAVDKSTPVTPSTVGVKVNSEDYYALTASVSSEKQTEAIHSNDALDVDTDKDLFINAPFTQATGATDASRKEWGLKYTVDDSKKKDADVGRWAYATHAVTYMTESYNVGDRIVEGSTTFEAAGITANISTPVTGYVIPASALVGDVVLYPVSGEQVIVSGGTSSTIDFTVNGVTKTLAGTGETTLAGTSDGTDAAESAALTGEEYKFTVAPKTGHRITGVAVDMYDKAGVAPTRYSVGDTAHPLTRGDYGEYTVPAITGKLKVLVTVVADSAEKLTITKVVESGSLGDKIDLYRVSDKKPITGSVEMHTSGDDFIFKAEAKNGYAVKKVSISPDGNNFQDITSTGVNDGKGGLNFTVSSLNTNLTIKVEGQEGFTFRKVTNPYATVKVNGIEVGDNKTLTGIPAGDGVEIEVTGKDSETKNVWYTFVTRDASATNIRSEEYVKAQVAENPDTTEELSPTGGIVSDTMLNDISQDDATSNEFMIYVKTERAEDPAKYTGRIVTSGVAKPINVTSKGLTLYSGGATLTTQGADVTKSTLATTFTRKDHETVANSDATNTTYTLGVTDLTAAARFGAQKASSTYNVLTTTNVAHEAAATDTITVKETVAATNWMDTLSYTATGNLTVKPLAELYAGYDFVASFDSKTSEPVLSGGVLRAYTKGTGSTYDDDVALVINPYTFNTQGEKVYRENDYKGTSATYLADAEIDGDGKKFIKSIAYGTDPEYRPTAVDGDILVAPGPTNYNSTGRTISRVKETGTATVTTDIVFADGSKTTLTKEIPVVPQTHGFFALPTVTVNGSTKFGYSSTLDLALTQSQATSGQVEFRVFEDLKGTGISTLIGDMTDDVAIDKLKTEGKIREVSSGVTFSAPDGLTGKTTNAIYNKSVTASVAGSKYTVTAAKIINGPAEKFIAVGKVGTTPITITPIDVTVGNKLFNYTVKMDLTDANGADLPDATEPDLYKYPLLDATKPAGKTLLDLAHSDIETELGEDETCGYVFDAVTAGQTIVLPDATAFTGINPKRTLIGWRDLKDTTDPDDDEFYHVNAEYVVEDDAVIVPIWAYKYHSVPATISSSDWDYGDGKVSIFTNESEAPVTASEKLAKGTTVTPSAYAYTIDWEKTPNADGEITWSEDPVKLTGTTKAVKVNTSDDSLTIPSTGATITGAKVTTASSVTYTFTDDAYTYAKRTGANKDLTVETTSFAVETPEEWNVEMDNIEVEEGIEAPFKVYLYKKGNKGDGKPYTRDDAVKFNTAKVKKVMTSIVAGDDYAFSEEDLTGDALSGKDTVMVRGLEAGKSATLLLTVITEQNIAIPVRVPISVKTTKKKIVVKKYNGTTNALAGEKGMILVPVNSTDADTNILFALEEDGTEQTTGTSDRWTFVPVIPDPDTEEERLNVVKDFAQEELDTPATATLTQVGRKDGKGQVEIRYELDTTTHKAFYQTLDVKTYYELKFAGRKTGETPAFTVKKGTVTISSSDYSSEKIVYDGQTSHTISAAASYTAALDVPSDTLSWLGWSKGDAASFIAQKADYAAGQAIVLDEKATTGVTAWPFTYSTPTVTVSAMFGPNPVESVTGLDTVIRLTDESPAKASDPTAKSTTAKTLTDYAVEDITARPGSSGADIYVTADDIGLFTIVDGDTPNREDLKAEANDENAWNTVSIHGTDDPHVTPLNEKRSVLVNLTPNLAKTFRDGSFTIAKVPGMVGASKIKVASGSLEYEIPVYVNGAYIDTTVTPNVERYMVDGENFVEGTKVVDGNTKYYKDSKVITDGVVFVTVDGQKKLVMIAKSKQVVSPAGGTKSYDDKNYYIGTDGFLKYGGLFAGEGATDKDKKYYADENGVLATSELKEIDGVTYYFNSRSEMAVASATANTYELDSVDHKYYVNTSGNVAIAELFTMGGKQYLANEKGELVTYAMTTGGKITVDGVDYIVNKDDNTAKRDDILYNPVVTFAPFPTKWLKSSVVYPVVTYTGSVTSANTDTMIPISGNAVVTSEPATISGNELEIKFTARVDLSQYFADKEGKTPAQGVSQTATYRFANGGDEGISDVYYDTKVTWKDKFPAKWDYTKALPEVTYTITHKAASNPSANAVTTGKQVASISRTDTKDVSGNIIKVKLVASTNLSGYFVDKEGKKPAQDETIEQTYTFKKNSPSGNAAGEGGEDGKTESEPEESNVPGYRSYNLFYTGQEIEVPGLSAALGSSTSLGTKADQYYKVSGTDTVVVSVTEVKKIKKAANASNSLISFTGSDGEVFAYQLPVYYQKPTLKLTKTSASIRPKSDGNTTVTTTVTQKKSTKLFEPLEITDQKEGKAYWTHGKGTAPDVKPGEEDGELAITANAKGSGKIHIELKNWAEGIDLSYSVKEVSKDTLTASAKTVYMNTNAESGDDQEVQIFLNGEEFSGKDAGVTLKDWPKNWSSANVDVDGINDDKTVEGSTITFKYKGAPVKGNYSFKFVSKDKKAVTVKLSVSNKTLDKAVSLSVKTKADIVTGQKMVVVPTLKYVGGPVEDVTLEGTDADKFKLDNWNAATNQIIIVPSPDKAPTDYNTKTKYNLTVNVEAGGITCPIALKNFKVSATKPSVKIAAVTMKVDGSAEGYTNLVATYKQGGKTFSIEPTSVAITSNAAGGEVTYDPDEGKFHIDKPTKAGKVKVAVTFADGKAQNKSFSIKKAK